MKVTAALALVLLVGCGPGTRYLAGGLRERPVVVTDLHTAAASLDRADFSLGLLVRNPHRWAGTLESVTWDLEINGRWFAAGTQAANGTLGAADALPLALRLETAFHHPGQAQPAPSVSARVRGNVRVKFPLGPEQLEFDSTATLETLGAPLLPGEES